MSLLKSPNQIHQNVLFKGLIYGQPGVGKTTLALSAPNPVLIDADNGLHRVEARFRVPSLPLDDYKNVLALLQSDELAPFQTIVIDTLGRLIEIMGEYLMQQNPKLRQGDGSMTMKGWGAIKVEFQNFLRLIQSVHKHVIFVAHEKEEKEGDATRVRPDVPGSSGKEIVKLLDFMGYMQMIGDKRAIYFNPTERHYAKNSLKLDNFIQVPSTEKGNTFMAESIFGRARQRNEEEVAQNVSYQELCATLSGLIDLAADADAANAAFKAIEETTPIWDSHIQAKRALNAITKEAGLIFDKKAKAFQSTATPKTESKDAPADTKPV